EGRERHRLGGQARHVGGAKVWPLQRIPKGTPHRDILHTRHWRLLHRRMRQVIDGSAAGMNPGPAPVVLAPGLVGKIPAQGDFVRINAADRTALELVRWLEEAHELLRRTGSALPAGPI